MSRVTVPVELTPPSTVAGSRLTPESTAMGAVTVRLAVVVAELYVAEITTGVAIVTGVVVTANVAVVWPSRTVTEAGTWAAALSLVRLTTAPPAGAAMSRVTVPVELPPPSTVVGSRLTPESTAMGL